MSTFIEARATDVAAVIEYLLAARTRCTPEEIAVLLGLTPIARMGAELALVDDTLIVDPGLSRDEQAWQWARGIARYLIREGAQCHDEVALARALMATQERREQQGELARTAG